MKAFKSLLALLLVLVLCTGAAAVCSCSIDFFQQCQADCLKWMEGFSLGSGMPHRINFPG